MKKIGILFAVLVTSLGLGAQDRLAFVGLENQSGDTKFAYLAPVIEGLLLYDLSEKGSVELVERKNLQNLMAEQEFQKSGITDGASAARLGKVANAKYLVYGSYTLVSGEVVLNLSLSDVSTAEVTVFRERGFSEHLVHHAAEKIIKRVNGRQVVIADGSNNRSLVNLRDETPGTLNLHSRIIGAKIFIDGEFAGFTKGDERTAIPFHNLPPGRHTLRTYLADDFGVFSHPDLGFKPWETTFDIKPGRETALLDPTMRFYDAVDKLQDLGFQNRIIYLNKKKMVDSQKAMEFTNQAGQKIQVTAGFIYDEASDSVVATLSVQKATSPAVKVVEKLPLPKNSQPRVEKTLKTSDVELQVTLLPSGEYFSLRWEAKRVDFNPESLAPAP